MTTLGTLKSSASAALIAQIEQMVGNVMELVAHGFSFALASALVMAVKSGRPDIGELRGYGVDQATSVAICSAIAARHARVAAALASVPKQPEPTSREAAKPEPLAAPVAAPAAPVGIANMDRPAIVGRLSPEALAAALLPAAPSAPPESIDRLSAMSVLYVLTSSIEAERACVTELCNAGLSAPAAKELAFFINSTRSF
jgi:hypothetical protein